MGLLPILDPKKVLALQCPLCPFVSHYLNQLADHFDGHHESETVDFTIFQCPLCDKLSSSEAFISEHMALRHPQEEASSMDVKELTSTITTAGNIHVYFSGKLTSSSVNSQARTSLKSNTTWLSSNMMEDVVVKADRKINSGIQHCVFCGYETELVEEMQEHYAQHGIRNIKPSEKKPSTNSICKSSPTWSSLVKENKMEESMKHSQSCVAPESFNISKCQPSPSKTNTFLALAKLASDIPDMNPTAPLQPHQPQNTVTTDVTSTANGNSVNGHHQPTSFYVGNSLLSGNPLELTSTANILQSTKKLLIDLQHQQQQNRHHQTSEGSQTHGSGTTSLANSLTFSNENGNPLAAAAALLYPPSGMVNPLASWSALLQSTQQQQHQQQQSLASGQSLASTNPLTRTPLYSSSNTPQTSASSLTSNPFQTMLSSYSPFLTTLQNQFATMAALAVTSSATSLSTTKPLSTPSPMTAVNLSGNLKFAPTAPLQNDLSQLNRAAQLNAANALLLDKLVSPHSSLQQLTNAVALTASSPATNQVSFTMENNIPSGFLGLGLAPSLMNSNSSTNLTNTTFNVLTNTTNNTTNSLRAHSSSSPDHSPSHNLVAMSEDNASLTPSSLSVNLNFNGSCATNEQPDGGGLLSMSSFFSSNNLKRVSETLLHSSRSTQAKCLNSSATTTASDNEMSGVSSDDMEVDLSCSTNHASLFMNKNTDLSNTINDNYVPSTATNWSNEAQVFCNLKSEPSVNLMIPTSSCKSENSPGTTYNNRVDEPSMYNIRRSIGLTRTNLPFDARKILFSWLVDHLREPYPSEEEKMQLAVKTKLSRTTVNNWFINARRRYVKPLSEGRLILQSGVFKTVCGYHPGDSAEDLSLTTDYGLSEGVANGENFSAASLNCAVSRASPSLSTGNYFPSMEKYKTNSAATSLKAGGSPAPSTPSKKFQCDGLMEAPSPTLSNICIPSQSASVLQYTSTLDASSFEVMNKLGRPTSSTNSTSEQDSPSQCRSLLAEDLGASSNGPSAFLLCESQASCPATVSSTPVQCPDTAAALMSI